MAEKTVMDEVKFKKMWSENVSAREMAKVFNCTYGTVNLRAREMGLKPRNLRNQQSGLKDTQEFRSAWADGKTLNEIGHMIGCCSKHVKTLAKKFGYPDRPKPDTRSAEPEKPVRDDVEIVAVHKSQGTIHEANMTLITLPKLPKVLQMAEPETVSYDGLRSLWQKDVMELASKGLGAKDIAKRLFCSETDVQYEIQRQRGQGSLPRLDQGRHV